MEALELRELVHKGESSLVQFKETINHVNQLSQEFSALANTEGGIIEILRLFQSAGKIYADEGTVPGSSLLDINEDAFKKLLINKFRNKFRVNSDDLFKQSIDQLLNKFDENISVYKLLQNMKFSDENALTLAGLLLIGSNPQKYKPLFSIKCISFLGNEISNNQFRDKEDLFEGNLLALFTKSMEFIVRNLKKIQVENGFNSLGQLEIPLQVLEEMIVNALVHRDYYISSSIQIFIFDNRLEIISPGKLPNTLNENNIKYFTSIARNPIIYSNCAFAGLPFTGIGSGIPRAMTLYPNITLINDRNNEKFTVIIPRKEI